MSHKNGAMDFVQKKIVGMYEQSLPSTKHEIGLLIGLMRVLATLPIG